MSELNKAGKASKVWREENKPAGRSEPRFPYKDMSVVQQKELNSPESFLFEQAKGFSYTPRNIFNARLTLSEPS